MELKELKTALVWEIVIDKGRYTFTKDQLARFALEQREMGVEEYKKEVRENWIRKNKTDYHR